jgi:phytoene/squalene synthetase
MMSATQHLDLPTQARRTVSAATNDDTMRFRLRAAGSSFFWAMQLLPHQRREAMYALYGFCREVDDIADGDAPRSLKHSWLSDWRNATAWRWTREPIFGGPPWRGAAA